LHIVENIPLEIEPNEHNKFYLETKRQKMGHSLELVNIKTKDKER
ncbi:MAG: bifunctional 3,4-dihydroxy-2-butanone-4-phosphate synthase/GTP cyclohydrolase II, partial [Marinilabiliales bacterium]